MEPPPQPASPLKRRKLGSTDILVPELSFGASSFGHLQDSGPEEDEAQRAIRNAIQWGVNYFDTAPWYGQGKSEIVLGKVHDIEFAPSVDVIIRETLPALDSLRQAGIVRHIGVTGYPLHTLKEVIEKSPVELDTVLTYCRGTLFDDSLCEYLPFFENRRLGVINAAPLGMGLLTSSPPPAWHPASEDLKRTCAQAALFCKDAGHSIERLGLWHSLSKFTGVHTTVVGMKSSDMLVKNMSCTSVSREEEEFADLVRKRYFEPPTSNHWEGVEVEKVRKKLARRHHNLAEEKASVPLAQPTCNVELTAV